MNKKSVTIARVLLGAMFFIFGLNGFLNFIPPQPMPEGAGQFLGGLASSGYFFPFLKGTEVLMGALLLLNLFVPLALTILAPIVINITLFHLFLAPAGLAVVVVILALEIFLAYSYRDKYKSVLEMK